MITVVVGNSVVARVRVNGVKVVSLRGARLREIFNRGLEEAIGYRSGGYMGKLLVLLVGGIPDLVAKGSGGVNAEGIEEMGRVLKELEGWVQESGLCDWGVIPFYPPEMGVAYGDKGRSEQEEMEGMVREWNRRIRRVNIVLQQDYVKGGTEKEPILWRIFGAVVDRLGRVKWDALRDGVHMSDRATAQTGSRLLADIVRWERAGFGIKLGRLAQDRKTEHSMELEETGEGRMEEKDNLIKELREEVGRLQARVKQVEDEMVTDVFNAMDLKEAKQVLETDL